MATADTTPTNGENSPAASDTTNAPFDFGAHRRQAVDAYREVRELFGECAQAVRSVLRAVLDEEQIKVQFIEARGKSVNSFGEKVEKPAKDDANRPRYPEPINDITDLAGVRVIVYLLDQLEQVDTLIYREFEVLEKAVPPGVLGGGGYQSTHYLVKFKPPRSGLPEYERFRNLIVEIQARTVLRHGWAEIEHGIVYKQEGPVEEEIRTRLLKIAGALRMADREFQRVETDSKKEDSVEGPSGTAG